MKEGELVLDGKLKSRSEREIARDMIEAKVREVKEKRQRYLGLRLLHKLGIHTWVVFDRDTLDGFGEIKATKCYFCKKWRLAVFRSRVVHLTIASLVSLVFLGASVGYSTYNYDPIFLTISLPVFVLTLWATCKFAWENLVTFVKGSS